MIFASGALAHKSLLPTSFRLEGSAARDAKEVFIYSCHNNWQKLPLNKDGRNFMLNVDLPPGSYKYKFEVNGVDTIDPTKSIEPKENEAEEAVLGPFNRLDVDDGQFVVRQHLQTSSPVISHYGLYIPKDYLSDPEKTWPSIVFLHGAGECGDEIYSSLLRQDLPRKLASGSHLPFVVIAPHCPRGSGWGERQISREVISILEEVSRSLRLDMKRVYLSLGGYGCWALAADYPRHFAAMAPICGGGHPEWAHATAHIPQWAFTNRNDPIVPYQHTNAMVQHCKRCGADIQFTVFPRPLRKNEPHDSWTEAYNTPELYDWFLKHKLQ